MTVRDYASPDPRSVVSNIRKVLDTQDMSYLSKGAYAFLITHCGFIAHYNQTGFIETYKGDMAGFVDGFLSQMGMGWDVWLNNPRSYLYDTSYKGKLVADIVRELVLLFTASRERIVATQTERVYNEAEQHLRAMAEKLGYNLVKR